MRALYFLDNRYFCSIKQHLLMGWSPRGDLGEHFGLIGKSLFKRALQKLPGLTGAEHVGGHTVTSGPAIYHLPVVADPGPTTCLFDQLLGKREQLLCQGRARLRS
jgi:hypothetical protein